MKARATLTTKGGWEIDGYGESQWPAYALSYAVDDAYRRMYEDWEDAPDEPGAVVVKLKASVE